MGALTTTDLVTVMKNDPSFRGVFALDRIPSTIPKSTDLKLIINLDPASKPGSHWVAIWRKNNVAYYFDSFGRIPPDIIRKWLIENTNSWIYNDSPMQTSNDKTACGYLCISFLTNKFKI